MALGAMAKYPELDVKIVPVGLNYFHPHRFRSRAVVSYGPPISIDKKLVQDFQNGGEAKREATGKVLQQGRDGLKSVTVNAPDYDVLLIIQAARRLYQPAHRKLRLEQVVELNRRFLIGWTQFKDDPRVIELARKVRSYNQTLKYFGIRDHQVEKTSTATLNAAKTLIVRLTELLMVAAVGLPA
jgi:glycerol-3-phosphate O-acyltransferase/dihydroxyacetone phosphate acyltransferase